jgi:CheY-like chemotaxis protein
VDDDEDLRTTLADTLELEGFDVMQAASAEDGIARAEKRKPRIVLTDLSMPGMSGIELCDYFVALDHGTRPTVVIMSALSGAEGEAIRRGASAFLAKPFDVEELVSTLRTALGEPTREVVPARFASERQHTREASRAMAEAAFRTLGPDAHQRAAHVVRWLSGFYKPAIAALIMPRDGELQLTTSSDPDLASRPKALDALLSFGRSVVETGSCLIVPDVTMQPWLGLDPEPFRSILSVPLRFFDAPVAALCLCAPSPREFAAPDLALLSHVATRAMNHLQTGTRPLLSDSGLIGRGSFRALLEIEAGAASERGDDLAVVLFRMPIDREVGELLERLPARRMQLGEVRDDVVGLTVRARGDEAREAAMRGAELVRDTGSVRASAAIYLGAPRPKHGAEEVLAWAEKLLDATKDDIPERSHVVLDAHATFVEQNR